ncbi:PLAC8 family-domain-containing protein [Thelephora terrestris]|uniref:PLAC8 family-domain-containing protein n=1 Tax=Thelephora terrestris TaxID=56493 RepID=A0A9P6HB89_9AGAM|nr:PLAC8 family-domain-containing protein [Thelephora terrestris]
MQIASNTNTKNLPLDSSGRRGWSHSLFGCFSDCGTCLTAVFCPCIVYSKISTRLDHLNKNGSPHPSGGDACGGSCIGYTATCCIGVSCILQTIQRGNTRSRYNISGNGCTDFLAACCCHVCDLVQESREIELEENSYGKQSY